VELAPGDADHSPSGDLQAPIAFPVGLERRTGPVCAAAVEFDDHPLRSPKAVSFDLVAVDVEQDVQLTSRQVGAGKQRRKSVLELAATPTPRPSSEATQAHLDRRRPAPARMELQQPLQSLEPKAMEVFRLAKRRFKSFGRHLGGNVEEGASESGDRDPAPHSQFVRDIANVTPSDRRSRSRRPWRGDFDAGAIPRSHDAPELARRPVTEDSPVTDAKDGCEPATLPADDTVPDCKDARVEQVQAARTNSPIDSASCHSDRRELPPRHHPILPLSKPSDLPIHRTRLRSASTRDG
jgi:hypothetical protein